MSDDIKDLLAERAFRPKLQPRIAAAFDELQQAGGTDHTLKGIETLRRVVKMAGNSPSSDERDIARLMVDKIDEFIGGLKPQDLVGFGPSTIGGAAATQPEAATTALANARKLWATGSKADTIETLSERAANRAGQFTGSGYENALRTEFRQLAQNKTRMRTFTSEEQDAIRAVARGGPIGNILRWVGKFRPSGVVSAALGSGIGHAIGGSTGAAIVPIIGAVGRAGATSATQAAADRVLETILGGPRIVPPNPLSGMFPMAAGFAGQQASKWLGQPEKLDPTTMRILEDARRRMQQRGANQ